MTTGTKTVKARKQRTGQDAAASAREYADEQARPARELLARAQGRQHRRDDGGHRLAAAFGARRARRRAEEEGLRHHLGEDRRRPPLSDRDRHERGDRPRRSRPSRASISRVCAPPGATRYGAPPPLRSAELLRLLLAWRMQAEALGGLDRETRRQLQRRGPVEAEGLDLGVGARLRRDWQGRDVEVVVEATASAGRTRSIRASRLPRPPSPARAGTDRASSACGSQAR